MKLSLLFTLLITAGCSTALFAQPADANIAKTEFYYTRIDSLLDLKKISEALPYCDQLIQFASDTYGKTDTAYADALAKKSECLLYGKQYPDAITLQLEALEIRRTIPGEESSCVSSLNTLWQLNRYMGKYARAEQYLLEAISITEKKDTLSTDLITLYGNMGLHYRETGSFNLAESYYLKGIRLGHHLFGDNNMQNAATYNNIGNLYLTTGNLSLAEYYFLKFYNMLLAKSGEAHPKTRAALNNLALIYEDTGNIAKAEAYYKRALELDISKDTASYIVSLGNIATMYQDAKNFEKAEFYYQQCLDLQVQYLTYENSNVASTYSNIGNMLIEKKDYVKAREYLMKSLELRLRLFGEAHPSYNASLLGIAKVDFREGKFTEAVEKTKTAKAAFEKALGNKHPFYENAIFTLGDIYVAGNMLDSAEAYYLEGLHLKYYLIKQQFSYMSEMEKELYLKKIDNRSSVILSYFLARKATNPAITGEAYNYALNTKGLLLKSSTMLRNIILGGDNEELKDQYENWIALKKKINTLYNTPLDKRKEDPAELEEKADAMEKELVRSGSALEKNQDIMNGSWLDVQADLKKNEAAIEFIHYRKTTDSTLYCALIVTPTSKYPEMIPLFEEKQLSALLGNNTTNDYKLINTIYGTKTKKNAALYELIWEPLEQYLGKTRKVFVSPSGLLHKVAFAALSKRDGSFLSETLSLNMVSTTTDIAVSTELIVAPESNISLFGGIQYSADSSNSYPWQYLNGTKAESDRLSGTFKKYTSHVEYLTGNNATKSRFLDVAENSVILHIATHGFFFPDPVEVMATMVDTTESGDIRFRGAPSRAAALYVENQNPLMRSGLVFAGANDYWISEGVESENNGVLTALDVININLSKNKLTVMSACESGLGDIVGSEGVYGLQRAFKMAGTDFIIMSLWQVPDQETAEFMQTFYTLLFEQNDVATAFAQTQKIMRKKYDPYYWAAFVLLR